ncbi:MAG: hypothetical protein ACREJM_12645, partial [Candidatus Saccharimonadales bacterium]
YDAQTKNDAQALDTLVKTDADQLSSEAATEDGAGNYPSPWMDQWKSQAAAADAKADANADAALTQTTTDADAQDTQEKSAADAEQTKDDAAAQSAHDKIVSDAQAAHDKSIADATSITNAVAKDAYYATLPDAYPAFNWDPSLTPALLDASYAEVYAVDDVALPLSAGQDDGGSPLPPGDVIGANSPLPSGGQGEGSSSSSSSSAPVLGQAFSLGGTVDPFGGIATWTTPTGPGLLSDNGVYAPANPNLGFTGWPGAQWLNVGETMLASGGGSGSGGSGGQQAPQTPPMPSTDTMQPIITGTAVSENVPEATDKPGFSIWSLFDVPGMMIDVGFWIKERLSGSSTVIVGEAISDEQRANNGPPQPSDRGMSSQHAGVGGAAIIVAANKLTKDDAKLAKA